MYHNYLPEVLELVALQLLTYVYEVLLHSNHALHLVPRDHALQLALLRHDHLLKAQGDEQHMHLR